MDQAAGTFSFLLDDTLAELGNRAEKLIEIDPGAALGRFRTFGERLAKLTAMQLGFDIEELERAAKGQNEGLTFFIHKKIEPGLNNRRVAADFHFLRKLGNKSVHDDQVKFDDEAERGLARQALQAAR